jgi:hypothetical protein
VRSIAINAFNPKASNGFLHYMVAAAGIETYLFREEIEP